MGPRGSGAGVDRAGVTTALGGVFLEGLEVVFIVVALGGLQDIPSAVAGALIALLIVGGAGLAFRHPLTRVPENAMKYVVGIMLTSFGTFYAGEGIGVHWWGDDLSLLILIAAYGLASLAFVVVLRRPSRTTASSGLGRVIKAVALEVWGLFVDDGAVAVVAVVALLAVALFVQHQGDGHNIAGVLLIAGVLVAVGVGLSAAGRAARKPETPATPAESLPGAALRESHPRLRQCRPSCRPQRMRRAHTADRLKLARCRGAIRRRLHTPAGAVGAFGSSRPGGAERIRTV